MEIFAKEKWISEPDKVDMVVTKFRHAGFDMETFLSVAGGIDRWSVLCARALAWLDTRITCGSQNKPFLTVEEVVPVIDRAQEECFDNHGRGFDLFLNDYPGLLQTEMNKKGNYQQRQVMDMVYGAFVQLALQHGWHSMVAIQTNREGSKVSSGYGAGKYSSKPQEVRFLRKEDVLEAWGPIATATNVITVNRSPQSMAGGFLTYFLDKSRSSSTQLAVTAYERYAQCVSHSDDLGWVSYFMDAENRRLMQSFMQTGVGKFLTTPEIAGRLQELEAADEVAKKAA